MAGTFDILFNVAAFVAGLSLLERGATLFVQSATTLARRLRLPEVLVAILIAGAEWEELAVVTLSLAQQRPALAVGNIVGSAIANIFGAFALGLVFSTAGGSGGGTWEGFDGSSKTASLSLLALTSVVALFALADILWNRLVAGLLLLAFGGYVAFVLWKLWCAMFYTGQHEDAEDIESGAAAHEHLDDASSVTSSAASDRSSSTNNSEDHATESTPLFPKPSAAKLKKLRHTLVPIVQVLGGFVALTISGFLLAHTSAQLAASLAMSDAAFGATVLSLATTLPEKVLAVMSSTRGHTGLLVADAVGSNVFLLTLCLGLAAWSIAAHGWHDHDHDHDHNHNGRGRGGGSLVDIARIEAWWLWAAAAALAAVVLVGGTGACKVAGVRQLLGALMLVAYGGFVAVEFTILRD